MSFILGKLFWVLAAPGNLLALLLAIGSVILALTKRRRGFGLVLCGTIGFLAIAVLPVGAWVITPLENRFPQPTLPDRVDGIILLGGAVNVSVSQAHGQVSLNDAAERITSFFTLARRYPQAKLVVTGGDAELPRTGQPESFPTRDLLVALGLDPHRLVLESLARNTADNAVFTYEMVHPEPGQVWILVTSAVHMPRSVGCFRAAGWQRIIPYPVNYHTAGRFEMISDLSLDHNLSLLTVASREWAGLVAYRALGRIDSLFPGPR